jgi:hypothetical protein
MFAQARYGMAVLAAEHSRDLMAKVFERQPKLIQESTRICPGCKVERDFVDNINGLTTTCKSCRGTWDAFDGMFAETD